jgi:hypothetical protein
MHFVPGLTSAACDPLEQQGRGTRSARAAKLDNEKQQQQRP